ncbi:hypothetical protein EVAR_96234_1 [Eumeta japonica]|uniref:Uncharacterized protein n=1 Tax=Eumeta variegata TaxID=151549 RepID=A0A4C1WJP3_EUMVA|nr:hypothetical protein EVAR_96234_1 [Eumeta japonica]
MSFTPERAFGEAYWSTPRHALLYLNNRIDFASITLPGNDKTIISPTSSVRRASVFSAGGSAISRPGCRLLSAHLDWPAVCPAVRRDGIPVVRAGAHVDSSSIIRRIQHPKLTGDRAAPRSFPGLFAQKCGAFDSFFKPRPQCFDESEQIAAVVIVEFSKAHVFNGGRVIESKQDKSLLLPLSLTIPCGSSGELCIFEIEPKSRLAPSSEPKEESRLNPKEGTISGLWLTA